MLGSSHLHSLLILGGASILSLWLDYDSRLVLDDWAQIVSNRVFGHMEWFAWGRARPMDMAIYKAISNLFGLNIFAYYLINTLIILCVFFMIYTLLDRLLPQLHPFPLIVSLVALLYPADYTLTWITMINNRLAWLVALIGMWLLLEYATRGGSLHLILATLFFFAPLWIHEGALGVTITWCFCLALIIKKHSGWRRITLLSPLILLASFIALRIVFRPRMNVHDPNINNFAGLSPVFVWSRLKQVIVLAKAWVEPFPELFQEIGWGVWPKRVLLIGLAFVIGLAILCLSVMLRRYQHLAGEPFSTGDKTQISQKFGWTILFASGFLVAGYVPFIINFAPNLDDISTRANMYAIPAASTIIVAMIGLFALLLARSRKQWQVLLWIGVVPLLIIGLGVQMTIQQRWSSAWDQQTKIWKQLFILVPNFEDNTTVVLVLEDYQDLGYAEHPPLYAQWEVEHALRVLYEEESLSGRILFPSADIYSEALLTPDGVVGAYLEETPYDQVVFVKVEIVRGTAKLRLLYNLKEELSLPFQASGYDPEYRIDQTPTNYWRYRYLVKN